MRTYLTRPRFETERQEFFDYRSPGSLLIGLDRLHLFEQRGVGGGGQGRAQLHWFYNLLGCTHGAEKTSSLAGAANQYNPLGSIASIIPTRDKILLASCVRSAFLDSLDSLIAPKFSSDRQFILAAQPNTKERTATAYFSQVRAGKKPPPLEHIEGWADALELKGEKRQWFLDLAAVAHLPPSVQERFVGLLRQRKSQQETIDSMKVALEGQKIALEGYKVALEQLKLRIGATNVGRDGIRE